VGAGRPVRVLRLIARLNAGGPAHHVGILSSRLGAHGYDTLLIHGRVAAGEAALDGFDERYPCSRVELAALGREPRPADDLVSLWHVARALHRYRPAIVHTHTAKAGVLGRLAALTVRPRPLVVHTFHGHVFTGYFGPRVSGAYRRVEQALGRCSDALIGVSDATAADLVRLRVAPPQKVRMIPLGLDLEPFLASEAEDGAAVRAEVGATGGELVAISVGRLVAVKRVDRAIAAVADARARGAAVRLVVVGDGPLRGQLEAQARGLGIGDHVRFLGYRGDLDRLAAAADVALLTSDNEGTPVSLIEAAAAGRPAIATDVGGVREVVAPDAGVLVAREDVAGLSRALVAFAADPGGRGRAGAAARLHVGRRYSAARLVDDVDALYRELLERRR
jgi:glycosyltransferase involved in cell wall biosynthesis